MRALTNRQRRVLQVISDYQRANGYPPTIRELCSLLGLRSTSTICSYLNALERKGAIARAPASPRAIRITVPPEGKR
ncbi:MAG: LexA repressor [Armatimonadota bacterium]|nr:LexA repressor [Armatimonadota bacterium]